MLFQAGSLIVFLLFWQVPDIFGETEKDTLLKQFSLISDKITELQKEVNSLRNNFDQSCQVSTLDQDTCVKGQPHINGTKRITLWGNTTALCDTTTDGGGWIIIQRRTDGDVDFYRGWRKYKTGFGNLNTSFWLGNDAIHRLSEQGYNELRIELIYQGKRVYAHYADFSVASEAMNYQITFGAYTGTAGDSLTRQNYMFFTTFDRDNDKQYVINCAEQFKGAWWYNNCNDSNLNGLWGVSGGYTGMTWETLTMANSVSFSEMKIRRGY